MQLTRGAAIERVVAAWPTAQVSRDGRLQFTRVTRDSELEAPISAPTGV